MKKNHLRSTALGQTLASRLCIKHFNLVCWLVSYYIKVTKKFFKNSVLCTLRRYRKSSGRTFPWIFDFAAHKLFGVYLFLNIISFWSSNSLKFPGWMGSALYNQVPSHSPRKLNRVLNLPSVKKILQQIKIKLHSYICFILSPYWKCHMVLICMAINIH